MPQSSDPAPTSNWLTTAREAIRHILLVVVVGMALATVFTIWTPSGLLPTKVAAQIAEAVQRVSLTPTVVTPAPLPSPTPASPKIGIVAGHSGPQNDPGAVCPDGLTEAAVNLDIATRVKAGLEANGFYVDLLTEFDPRLAGYKARAVVSIHNDSCEYINDQATGFKVAGALDVGASLESERLAACLTDRYPKQTGLPFHANTVTLDMTQYHSFNEVDGTTPIAIIETGFLNLDRKILTDESYRVAQGVIDGLLCYVLNQPLQPTPAP